MSVTLWGVVIFALICAFRTDKEMKHYLHAPLPRKK
ncbi:hypothetical protein ACUY4R_003387 [Kosakonia sp. BK9b]